MFLNQKSGFLTYRTQHFNRDLIYTDSSSSSFDSALPIAAGSSAASVNTSDQSSSSSSRVTMSQSHPSRNNKNVSNVVMAGLSTTSADITHTLNSDSPLPAPEVEYFNISLLAYDPKRYIITQYQTLTTDYYPYQDFQFKNHNTQTAQLRSSIVADTLMPEHCFECHHPNEPGTYSILVFLHGFALDVSHYQQLLGGLAAQGFVVIAPQLYTPGFASLFGAPSAEEESKNAFQFLNRAFSTTTNERENRNALGLHAVWLNRFLPDHIKADTDNVVIMGHSRGGQCTWLLKLLEDEASSSLNIKAIIGLDPVEGKPKGGFAGGLESVVFKKSPFHFNIPVLIFGFGMGSIGALAAAPSGHNFKNFYELTQAINNPIYQCLIAHAGHLDILDDQLQGCFGFTSDLLVNKGKYGKEAIRQVVSVITNAFLRQVVPIPKRKINNGRPSHSHPLFNHSSTSSGYGHGANTSTHDHIISMDHIMQHAKHGILTRPTQLGATSQVIPVQVQMKYSY